MSSGRGKTGKGRKRKHEADKLEYNESGAKVWLTPGKTDLRDFVEAFLLSHPCDASINDIPAQKFRIPKHVHLDRRGRANVKGLSEAGVSWVCRYLNGTSGGNLCLNPSDFGDAYEAVVALGLDEAKPFLESMLSGRSKSGETILALLKCMSKLPLLQRERVLSCAAFVSLAKSSKRVFTLDKHLPEFLELDFVVVRALLNRVNVGQEEEFTVVVRVLKWLQHKDNAKHAEALLPLLKFSQLSNIELAYLSVQEHFEDPNKFFHDFMVDAIKLRVSNLIGGMSGMEEYKFTPDLKWAAMPSTVTGLTRARISTTFRGRYVR